MFSKENIQKALLLSSVSLNPNTTTKQYMMVAEYIREMDKNSSEIAKKQKNIA